MNNEQRHKGFSLTEVLLSVGVLSIGMIFIAGVFPVAIHFTTIATERTLAAVVADEAFAKIRLYAIGDPNNPNDDVNIGELKVNELTYFGDPNVFPAAAYIDPNEFAYPSTDTDISKKQYYWSALCRRVDLSNVQVTVFVSRKTGPALGWQIPIEVVVLQFSDDKLQIIDGNITFINDGYTIADNQTGQLYRVLERYAPPADDTILLDRAWQGDPNGLVWVVPPPLGSGRYPCKAVYQKVIRF